MLIFVAVAANTIGCGCFLTSSAILLQFAPQTELMHEVTSLKNVVSNVEAHNVELEVSLSQACMQ